MNQDNTFAVTRSTASLAAQIQIGTAYVWTEKTNSAWAADLAAVPTQEELVADMLADLITARGALDGGVALAARRGRQILKLAKVNWRNDGPKLAPFQRIHFTNNGRNAVLADALAVESAWESADPAWVPFEEEATPPLPITLALFKAQREATIALLKPEQDAEAAWSKQDKMLNEQCAKLNENSVPWYAAVTARFAEGTPLGDMIRATVPTTYVPPVAPPGPAGFAELVSSEPGAARVVLSAPGAATYDIYMKGPEDVDFVKVASLVVTGTYETTGLPAGDYVFKGQGHTSGGYGPMSEEQTLTVE